jgi:NADH:ubiquinone oxidoreductase subunit 6 (subunit J)
MLTENKKTTKLSHIPAVKKIVISGAPVLSPAAEVVIFVGVLFSVLFVAVVALLHTLTLFIDALGELIFTLLLPSAAVVFAVFVPLLGNPIHALLCLLGLFGTTALIYLSQGAEYLALVFLIVYVGALAILFLFVIMLLNVKDIMSSQKTTLLARDARKVVSIAAGFLFAVHSALAIYTGLESLYLLSPGLVNTPTVLNELTEYVTADILKLRSLYTEH